MFLVDSSAIHIPLFCILGHIAKTINDVFPIKIVNCLHHPQWVEEVIKNINQLAKIDYDLVKLESQSVREMIVKTFVVFFIVG